MAAKKRNDSAAETLPGAAAPATKPTRKREVKPLRIESRLGEPMDVPVRWQEIGPLDFSTEALAIAEMKTMAPGDYRIVQVRGEFTVKPKPAENEVVPL